MSILAMLRKRQRVQTATVTVATLATHEGKKGAFEVGNELTVAKAATVTVATATNEKIACYRWLLHFGDRNPMEVSFSPPASHSEVFASYPDALAVKPIEAGRREAGGVLAGNQEATILTRLAQIGETDETTLDEVLKHCRRNEDGRDYFVARAADVHADSVLDDRKFCTQCGNLRLGVCVIGAPGEAVSAITGYRPRQNILHRCASYEPRS